MCALSITTHEIFANQIKRYKFDLQNEDQGQEGEKLDLRHSTGNVWFHIGEYFHNFSYPVKNVDANLNTHTTHIDIDVSNFYVQK